MRRLLAGLTASAILTFASAGLAAASTDVGIAVTGASLVARGAAVDVTYSVVCVPAPEQTSTTFNVEYGAVHVDQAVSKKVVAHGTAEPSGITLTCDGSTVNDLSARIMADAVPFTKGSAIVGLHLYLVDPISYYSISGDVSAVARLR